MKIGIVGFGGVGKAFLKLIYDKKMNWKMKESIFRLII